ncbi:PRC-barrel domain-containing protein [Oceanicella sp. SM1341]|uniref:PRC-barrel domain-containing protein n=1 Tax=Oceanicella sp. SM1341 TaxID=1548889 RepID=UPI000E4F6620|nr:PRC-barrel domain-containing protein [Oceanicella sp. SM1341]
MLMSYRDLTRCTLLTTDGSRDPVEDLYFDGSRWSLTHIVADTGSWLESRRTVIGAGLAAKPDFETLEWPVRVSQEQIRAAPRPESFPAEERSAEEWGLFDLDAMPPILIGPMGETYSPLMLEAQLQHWANDETEESEARKALPERPSAALIRSTNALLGHEISATDGEIGTISDVLVDLDSMTLRHIVVDTGNWLPGRQVVLPVERIEAFDWAGGRTVVNVDREGVKNSPPLEGLPDLDHRWDRSVLNYYGLGI